MHPLPARWLGDVGIDGEAQVGVPDDIGDEAAATMLIGTLTAMGLVQEAGVPKVSHSTVPALLDPAMPPLLTIVYRISIARGYLFVVAQKSPSRMCCF